MNLQLIEIASWRVASEICRKYPDSIRVVETHPGGGLYDCLSIYDVSSHGFSSHIDLNRGGSLHIFNEAGHQILSDIWIEIFKAAEFKDLVNNICRMFGLPQVDKVPASNPLTLVYRFIATFLTHAALGIHHWECRSGMSDTSGYGGGVIRKYFEKFPLAKERLRFRSETDYPGDPAYRFWFLLKNGNPFICLETSGNVWLGGCGETYNLMEYYKSNGRNIWKTVVSIAGPLML